nr:MAG: hypothetical protein [Molluscum contagiosum virus]
MYIFWRSICVVVVGPPHNSVIPHCCCGGPGPSLRRAGSRRPRAKFSALPAF